MGQSQFAKIIVERMIGAAGVKNQAQLAKVLGIKQPSVSGAITKGKIPDRWFEIIEEKYGISREDLVKLPTKEAETLIQSSSGNGISIQAGRDAKKNIVESGAGGLSNEEQELIDLIRQYGGSKTIESFKERLLKIKNLLEDN
ncbi:MAG: helix-turn-helix domain containing protein [Proteobacteria bacterium]|nr:helix-turn-helix domain containing protein [Pseudomonadota bacterium]